MLYENLSEVVLLGTERTSERKAWMQPSAALRPASAFVFLDAELYIERVKAPAIVQRLEQEGLIPASVAIYISNESALARHVDYTCSDDYAYLVADGVLPRLFERFPGIDSRRVTIVGLSLSGLQAAFIARKYPARFRAAICQSPSFWWNDENFRQRIPASSSERKSRYWISVGDRETDSGVAHPPTGMRQESSQIAACERTRDKFTQNGYAVRYRVFDGGHDPDCWREDLALALPWG